MTRCSHCNEPLQQSYCWFCQQIRPSTVSKNIVTLLDKLRFDPETHLGNGDVKLTKEKQGEILDLLKEL